MKFNYKWITLILLVCTIGGILLYNSWFMSFEEYLSYVTDKPTNEIDYNSIIRLEIDCNRVSDIKNLVKCNKLQSLGIKNCSPKDLKVVLGLKNLRSLGITNSNLTEIPNLNESESLEILVLSFNNIKVLNKEINKFKALSVVDLRNNSIDKIEPLTNTSIKQLNLTNNKITDISGLEGLKSIENLYLDGNPVSKAEVLLKMNSLKAVTLHKKYLSTQLIEALDKNEAIMMN